MTNKISYYLIGFLIFNILWYLIAIIYHSNALLNPIEVYEKMIFDFDFSIFNHLLVSLYRVAIALGISMVLSIVLTILMSEFKVVEKILNPIIYLMYPIPKTALLPVLMAILGLGDLSKILLLILIIIFQTIIYLQTGFKSIDKTYINTLISLGASRWQMIRYVKLPAVFSVIIASLKISLASAFAILFLIETYGTMEGLGYYIQDAWSRMDYLDMYFGIAFSGTICLVLFIVVDIIENKLKKKGY